jgi:cobalt-zinc-cadmium efflux system membrane fusion protein
VKEVRKQLGDPIESGDVLAIVESNESLQAYEVKAPHAGIITERNVTVGSVTADGALFVVTDHSSVWVDLNVLSTDANKVKAGLPVVVQTVDGSQSVELTLPEFLPGAVVESQTRVIRLQLDNRDGRWTPGLRVIATVTLPPHEVRVGVQSTGLQSFRDWTVVFAQVADTYEVRMLELGRSDGEHVEVLGGLEAGERYVTHNSFLVKADAMKSGASHDH